MFLTKFSPRAIINKLLCPLALPLSIGAHAIEPDRGIEEIIVSAEFRDSELLALANSVTVINKTSIKKNGAQHLENLLGLVPNVNYSSGASRGRFFQIRGIGERSQFVSPINPSIGLIIDGITLQAWDSAQRHLTSNKSKFCVVHKALYMARML